MSKEPTQVILDIRIVAEANADADEIQRAIEAEFHMWIRGQAALARTREDDEITIRDVEVLRDEDLQENEEERLRSVQAEIAAGRYTPPKETE